MRWPGHYFLAATLALAVSGLMLIWFLYFAQPVDVFSVVNHPWQSTLLHVHVLAAPLWVFLLGVIVTDHLLPLLRSRMKSGRWSGLANIAIGLLMGVSGYLLQVSSSDRMRSFMLWFHISTSVLFLLLFVWHLFVGFRWRGACSSSGLRVSKVLAPVFVLCALLSGCNAPTVRTLDVDLVGIVERSGPAMGTVFSVSVYARDRARARELAREAYQIVTELDRRLSTYRSDSEISKINRAANAQRSVRVSPAFAEVLGQALLVHQISGGLFDVTIGPLVRAWNFYADWRGEKHRPPSAEIIRQAKARTGLSNLDLDKATGELRWKRKGVELDFGAIGKGYALDCVRDLLAENRVPAAKASLGGQFLFMGRKPDGTDWQVSIRDPRHPRRDIGTLRVSEGSVATSGDYERYFVHEGRRYAHVLDPRTGSPVRGTESVTVWSKSAIEADAWSTALFVAGAAEGTALMDGRVDLGAIWISEGKADGEGVSRVSVSRSLRDRFQEAAR